MIIALCNTIYQLPFGAAAYDKRRAREIFNPGWNRVRRNDPIEIILLALHNIESDEMMAHVSASFQGDIVFSEGVIGVQITTLPKDFKKNDVPIVFDEKGEILVRPLWGKDFEPRELLTAEPLEGEKSLKNRILSELREAKEVIKAEMSKELEKLSALQTI